MKPDWRIYLSDGSTFDSLQGEPHEAPSEGFVCAVGYDETGSRYIMQSCDWYCFHKDQWWPFHTMDGLFNFLRKNGVYAFKCGETLTKTEFAEVLQRAHNDPDFPQAGRGN